MSAQVVVVGSANVDLTVYVGKLPSLGETTHGSAFQQSLGGKGANQAVQCRRLGVPTEFICMVGQDAHGEEYLASLRREGIDASHSSQCEQSTGVASIWVDAQGKNSIIIVPGANLCLTAQPFREYLLSTAVQPRVAVFQNEISESTTLECLQLLRAEYPAVLSIFNPAPATEGCRELARHCDVLCLNEVELATLSNLPTASDGEVKEAAITLLSKGCKAVVVTLGERGAALVSPGERSEVVFEMFSAEKVDVIDTVGAGDSFIGCFAANLACNVSIQTSIQRAARCASLSVQTKGAQPSYKYVEDIPVEDRPALVVS